MMQFVNNSEVILQSQCLAFRKEGEDIRSWDFYQDF